MTIYRQEIIERYRFPRHRGKMENPHAQGEVENSLCGDEITLFLKLDSGSGKITEAKFEGEGCALTIASADILCDYIIGKSKNKLAGFTAKKMLELYGEHPSPSRLKCVLLPYEALKVGLRV